MTLRQIIESEDRPAARRARPGLWTPQRQIQHKAGAAPAQQAAAVMPALPFIASAHEHTEPAFTLTVTPGAAVAIQNPIDIPASGYFRALWIQISAAGGAAGTASADFPWNLIQSIGLQEVNGSTILSPLDGYALYIANVVGGYSFNNDPAQAPFHVGTTPNPVFYLRIPVEIAAKDGLGALANQNAAAQYKLSLAINNVLTAWTVAPTTVPTLTIKGYLEAWTLPANADNRGRPQAQIPPMLGTGQYWSSTTRATIAGSNTLGITRVGNYIRALAFIARNGSGARDDTVFPDPFRLNWDGNMIHNASQLYMQDYFRSKIGGTFTRPAGVFVLPFNHVTIGRMGNEDPSLWLPTMDTTRLETDGVSASAGSLQALVNEIAPVETNQAQRYEFNNQSGAVGTAVGSAQ